MLKGASGNKQHKCRCCIFHYSQSKRNILNLNLHPLVTKEVCSNQQRFIGTGFICCLECKNDQMMWLFFFYVNESSYVISVEENLWVRKFNWTALSCFPRYFNSKKFQGFFGPKWTGAHPRGLVLNPWSNVDHSTMFLGFSRFTKMLLLLLFSPSFFSGQNIESCCIQMSVP